MCFLSYLMTFFFFFKSRAFWNIVTKRITLPLLQSPHCGILKLGLLQLQFKKSHHVSDSALTHFLLPLYSWIYIFHLSFVDCVALAHHCLCAYSKCSISNSDLITMEVHQHDTLSLFTFCLCKLPTLNKTEMPPNCSFLLIGKCPFHWAGLFHL